jgi:very-short-patch-repair endonuclease
MAAVDPFALHMVLDNAERRGLLDLAALDAFLERSRGFRGVARLRSALTIFETPAFTRSELERRFLALVRKAGLPAPKANLFVEGFEIDAFWPKERFAVELDTYEYHGGRRAFEADRIRHEELKLAGIEIVRITGARLDREPEVVMKRLSRLFAQRREQLGRPQPG